MSVWNKIDSGLALIYANFLDVREHGPNVIRPHLVVERGGNLQVTLYYTGDLMQVEEAGFKTIRDYGEGRASGALHLEDLARIAEREEVVSIHCGQEQQLHLDKSVPQIKANQVWTLGPAPLFVFGGNPGTDVIVGVIDSGADFRHPFLWLQSVPNKATRILRIWDMGLTPVAGESSPDLTLIEGGGGGTYGVEYKENQINDVLQGVAGALAIRHKDCKGHGTHVASIAAGDGRFDFKRIGVAPRANLVIVKVLELRNEPMVGPNTIEFDQKIKDAVTYILKIAAGPPKRPCAINYSIGTETGAHDGLDELANWLSTKFQDANSAGNVFIAAAGNAAGKRQHARIEFTAAGTMEIPFEVFDNRLLPFKEFGTCAGKDNTKNLDIQFYYPNGAATLECEVKPPGGAFKAGPALGGGSKTEIFAGHSFTMFNFEDPGKDSGVPVKRNTILVRINKPTPPTKHVAGTYTVKLIAGGPVKAHVWCFQDKKKTPQGVKLGTALPAGVTQEDRFLIGSVGCAPNVITVAAYSARDGALALADFSSRGPVARHGVGAAPADKPDIGAPGVQVFAAKSADILPVAVGSTIPNNGTSMAAPHVTGAVVLLLQKKGTLTPSQVRTILQTNALKVPAPVAEEIGGGRLDAKNSFDNIP